MQSWVQKITIPLCMLKPYVTAKFNRGVKNRRLPAFVETIRISQLIKQIGLAPICFIMCRMARGVEPRGNRRWKKARWAFAQPIVQASRTGSRRTADLPQARMRTPRAIAILCFRGEPRLSCLFPYNRLYIFSNIAKNVYSDHCKLYILYLYQK